MKFTQGFLMKQTMPIRRAIAFLSFLLLAGALGERAWAAEDVALGQGLADTRPNAVAFRQFRHGLFVHHVYGLTARPDGAKITTLDEFANAFDVNTFVDQVAGMGVEYVFLTAWHKAMYQLGPNPALERWLPGHTCKRDLVGEIADALNARGIKLVLYAHPNDGHDLSKDERNRVGYMDFPKDDPNRNKVLNDFINEVFTDFCKQYAGKPNVVGIWWDSWKHNGERIDMWRLNKTVRGLMPNAVLMSNNFDFNRKPNFIDFFSIESGWKGAKTGELNELTALHYNQSFPIAQNWWANPKATIQLSPESLYRFLVLTVGTGAPGGVAWAVSPLADGKTWGAENQPLKVMQDLNKHIARVRPSICGVLPSRNWLLPTKTTWATAPAFAAARSVDGSTEYIHVIKPPVGRTIELPKANERFSSARMLIGKKTVALEATDSGLRVTLPEGEQWDPLDTVVELVIAR